MSTPPDGPAQRYLAALARQLAADGCEPRWEDWDGHGVLTGQRADFRPQWLATRLHLFTAAMAVPEITLTAIGEFTRAAQEDAKVRKSGLPRGMQTGIALFPCLVSERADPAAMAWAAAQQRVRFALMARPVAVDAAHGTVATYRGTPALGWLYAAHLRRKLTLYFDGALRAVGSAA